MECKLKSGHTHGAPIDFGALQVVKGLGRLSVLYFAVLWTFFNKNDLTPEQLADFERRTSMRGERVMMSSLLTTNTFGPKYNLWSNRCQLVDSLVGTGAGIVWKIVWGCLEDSLGMFGR